MKNRSVIKTRFIYQVSIMSIKMEHFKDSDRHFAVITMLFIVLFQYQLL